MIFSLTPDRIHYGHRRAWRSIIFGSFFRSCRPHKVTIQVPTYFAIRVIHTRHHTPPRKEF